MSTDTVASTGNTEVIAAIKAHRHQLADQLHRLTEELAGAARSGSCERERNGLAAWYRTELLANVAAAEQALYPHGTDADATRLLVRGLVDEHRAMIAAIDALGRTTDAIGAIGVAGALSLLFDVHMTKENELLLPALDAAGVDLIAVLSDFNDALREVASADQGCGCGCDCGTADTAVSDTAVSDTSVSETAATDATAATAAAAPSTDTATTTAPADEPQLLIIGSRPPAPPVFEPAADGELDVRLLPHGARHDIIFGKLNELAIDEALVIVNDHDPKPLRYQTEALWPGCFEWEYLDAGPTLWRLAITRVDSAE